MALYRVEYTDTKLNLTFKHVMSTLSESENELKQRINNNFPPDRFIVHGWIILK